jgi:hypothetical protein
MKRIQKKRVKGFRMPAIPLALVSRPTKWGNPWRGIRDKVYINTKPDRRRKARWEYYCPLTESVNAVTLYKDYILHGEGRHLLNDLHELRGKTLICWCRLDEPCHGDVLIELINQMEDIK